MTARTLTASESATRHTTIVDGLRNGLTWGQIGDAIGVTANAAAKWAVSDIGQQAIDELRAESRTRAAAERASRVKLSPHLHPGLSGWELHCERCERTPVRVYPSRARAEKARQLHDRCCEGVDTTIRGRAA